MVWFTFSSECIEHDEDIAQLHTIMVILIPIWLCSCLLLTCSVSHRSSVPDSSFTVCVVLKFNEGVTWENKIKAVEIKNYK